MRLPVFPPAELVSMNLTAGLGKLVAVPIIRDTKYRLQYHRKTRRGLLDSLEFIPLIFRNTAQQTQLQLSNRKMTRALTNILSPSSERYFRMRPIDLMARVHVDFLQVSSM